MSDVVRRGDVVLVALPGDLGKPRPALVVQSDDFNATHATVTLLPITSHQEQLPIFRIPVEPTPGNGLRAPSRIMVDKITSHRREKVSRVIGQVDEQSMRGVDTALLIWLGLGTGGAQTPRASPGFDPPAVQL